MKETNGKNKDVVGQLRPVTEAMVLARTDQGSFSRGEDYMRRGNIEGPVLRGNVLRALCRGRSGGPYRLEVTLVPRDAPGDRPFGEYDCSCPVGGLCKHIVALLLLWIRKPESIEVRPALKPLLEDKSREELLDLIGDIASRYPETEDWIETMIATSVKPGAPGAVAVPGVSAARIRSRASAIVAQAGDDWLAAERAAEALEDLLEAGHRYAEARQWASAQAVYTGITEAIIERWDELLDEEGEIFTVLNDCAEGLSETLDAQEMLPDGERLPAEARLALLRTLFDTWNLVRQYGELDTTEPVPDLIARLATRQERDQVEEWVRGELSRERQGGYAWSGSAVMDFLLTLKRDQLSEEETLAEYRRAGMYAQLAERLLELGRSDEAIEVAANHLSEPHTVYGFVMHLLDRNGTKEMGAAISLAASRLENENWLLRFADGLIERGHAERAIELVEQRLEQLQPRPAKLSAGKLTAKDKAAERARRDRAANASHGYLSWLEEHYFQQGMAREALDAARQLFKSRPSLQTYQKVRRAATMSGQPAGAWAEVRPALMDELQKQMDWDALAGLHLEEGEIADALAVLTKQRTRHGTSWGMGRMSATRKLQIADAAAAEFPDQARQIYVDLAEQAIEFRQRENYRHAAELLSKARKIYARQGQQEDFAKLIAGLRQKYNMLRALKEELAARDL